MNIPFSHRPVTAAVIGLFAILASGCVVQGGGYGGGGYGGGGAAYGVGYYQPSGVVYGGWGSGYEVAPFRGGDHRPVAGGGGARSHAYRSAPASRSIPSIPSRSRAVSSGGHSSGHSGGGHGGGGRGGSGGNR